MKPVAYAIRQAVLNGKQRRDLKRRVCVAFESLQKGTATDLDVNDIINAGNISLAMSEFIAELDEYLPAIKSGLDALESMGERFNGRWGLAGDERAAITGMLDVYDIILSSPQLTRGIFSEAAAMVRAKIVAGQVRGASNKPAPRGRPRLKSRTASQRKPHRCHLLGRAIQHSIKQRQRPCSVGLSQVDQDRPGKRRARHIAGLSHGHRPNYHGLDATANTVNTHAAHCSVPLQAAILDEFLAA